MRERSWDIQHKQYFESDVNNVVYPVSKLETPVWILNLVSKSITLSLFTLKAPYLANDQSQHDRSRGSVSLSIS